MEKRMIQALRVTLLIATLLLQPIPPAPSSAIEPCPGPVPPSYFGIHLHRPSEATWPRVPAAEWRLWDSKGTTWYDLEPRPGEWNFAQLDRDVAMAEQHGVGLLLTLGQSPRWASMRPNDPPAWRPGGPAPPRDEEDWKRYVRTVAVRYRGRIRAFEIWNEPNLKNSFTGTREQLVALAQDAYQIIHQVDPTAIVVSPSVTGGYDVPWFSKFLDLGGGQSADVIGYHFYSSPHAPESSVDVIRQVKASMAAHGIHKPLWNTESGYTIQSDYAAVAPESGSLNRILTHREAMAYVMRAYLLNWASGVSRLYWYDWDGARMGLGDNLGTTSKPAAAGYAAVRDWLLGATVQGCGAGDDGNWTCELSRAGKPEFVVWNPERAADRTIPATWKVSECLTLSAAGDLISSPLPSNRILASNDIPTLVR
jgi:hypothetical protein